MGFAGAGAEQGVIKLSVPHTDAEWNLNQSRARRRIERSVHEQVGATLARRIHVGAVPEMRLPGEGTIVDVAGSGRTCGVASYRVMHVDGFTGPVHNQIQPLVEYHQSPSSVRNIGKGDVSSGIARLQTEGLTVRVTQSRPATGIAQRLVIQSIAERGDVAGVELLAWWTILMQIGDLDLDRVASRATGEVCILA